MPSIETRPSTRKFNSIVLGDSVSNSSRTLVIGTSNILGTNCEGTIVAGNNNQFFNTSNTQNSFIQGDNNIFYASTSGSFVFGNNNQIGTLTTSSDTFTAATGNTPISVTGVTLLGVSNYTATTSDTVYVPNIQFTSPAGTINGVSITSIVAGSSIVTSGTGRYSVRVINDADTLAGGDYSASLGGNTKALGDFSFAVGGGTLASGYASHAEGANTTASGYWSHAQNSTTIASGDYSHAGGFLSTASGSKSFVHGSGSTATGVGSIVLGNGLSGTAANTVYVPNIVLAPTQAIPVDTLDPVGEVGQITCDGTFFYFKTASGWLRTSGSTF